MTEVISGGPPERPPAAPGVRRAVAVLTAVLVLAAGTWAAVLHRTSTQPVAEHTTDAPRTATSVPPALPSPRSTAIEPTLSGVPTGGPAGLRLLVGGPALMTVDAATGAQSVVGGVLVPAGGAVTQLLPIPGGIVVVVQADPGGLDGPGRVYVVRRGQAPVELVRADEVILGARSGRLWGLTYPRQQGGKSLLVELTTAGRLLSERLLPEGWQVAADTPDGLLVAAYRQEGPGELSVVDPVSLRARRSLGPVTYVAAATPRLAAWVICSGTCGLVVGDLRGGGQPRTFQLPTNAGIGSAAFSPDQRKLAIAHLGRHGGGQLGTPGFVQVLDLDTGRSTRVPDVGTPEKQSADLSWSPDGRWLAIGVRWPEDGYQRVGVWRVSGGPVIALPGRLPGEYLSALLAVLPEAVAS